MTAELKKSNKLTIAEAERLASFTNFSNPLFMIGAVAYGFFENASLGLIIILSHYLGNICVGIMMRFHKRGTPSSYIENNNRSHRRSRLHEAIKKMHEERLEHWEPFGKKLGDAVYSSVSTLLMVGGFIILFSVLNQLLNTLAVTDVLSIIVGTIFQLLQIPGVIGQPFISGLFEITLGSQQLSELDQVPLLTQITVTSFILAFSGFSVHAQVASILAEANIRFRPFFFARMMHACFAATWTILLWHPLNIDTTSVTSGARDSSDSGTIPFVQTIGEGISHYGSTVTLIALIIYVFVISRRLTTANPMKY